MNTARGWFTLTELQERLNRADRRCLRRALVSAGVPHFDFGRETLFSEAAFVAWIERNQVIKTKGKGAA